MKLLLLPLLLVGLVGCAEGNSSPKDYGPDPAPGGIAAELQTYVDQFESTYSVNVNYTVEFDTENETGGSNSSGGTTIGVCRIWKYDNGVEAYREVLINKAWWDTKGTLPRKLLIFHELGHCQFNRDHDDRKYSNNMPFSLMNSILNPVITFYPAHENYYLNELLNPIPSSTANGSPAPSGAATWAEQGYTDEEYINIQEHHSMSSPGSDEINCEEIDRHYLRD